MQNKEMKQKNLNGKNFDTKYSPAFYPDKIKKSMMHRIHNKNRRKLKKIIKCTRCGKPILPPFGGAICGDCLKKWDIQKYCQILARDHYGKATKCMKCGLVAKNGIEWHHLDYSKPLEVISLCKKCHGLAHRLGNNFECAIVKPRMKKLSKYDHI